MARPQGLESPVSTRAVAVLLSTVLHVGLLLLIVLSGGRRDGVHYDDTPLTRVVLLDSQDGDRRDGMQLAPWTPVMPRVVTSAPPQLRFEQPEPQQESHPAPDDPPEEADAIPHVDVQVEPEGLTAARIDDSSSTEVVAEVHASAFLRRIERLAEDNLATSRTHVEWHEDGRHYEARFVQQPTSDGSEPDRVVAEISAEDLGRRFRTRIVLKRLPFSHFAQVIDRWDPMVQLHDDVIVGRMHINSRFNVLYDSQAAPRFLGKVSTAAGGFNMRGRSRGRQADVFRDGVETRATRIPIAAQRDSFESARFETGARVHELQRDTRIRFMADGRYSWSDIKARTSHYGDASAGESVYFIAARGTTVHVQGVVSGRFLVYSPERIVVEGGLAYGRDPRLDRASADYLGLVCDKDIEVARPHVTGSGDLLIQAALFAKRRVVITDTGHSRSRTLNIYGSLAAGSMTESEPRYATRVEYDPRFEQLRPPRFPSTNRFAAEEWDGQWTEALARSELVDF